MRRLACALTVCGALTAAVPVWAAPQGARLEQVSPHPAQAAGVSLAAAVTNLVYMPLRLVLTVVSAEVGGVAGWLTGGNEQSAEAVWGATAGQVLITPAIIEGRERLRFGS